VDPSFGEFVGGALRLDRATFDLVEHSPIGLRVALTVLLLAGASETLGQAVVLVLNRVSKRRFALALVLGGLELVFEALVWIAVLWLLAGLFGGERASFLPAVRVLGLAYAPLLFGVLVFLPYIGPVLARLLRVWVLLAVVTGTSVVFGLVPVVWTFWLSVQDTDLTSPGSFVGTAKYQQMVHDPVFWQAARAWLRDPLPIDRIIEKLNPEHTDVHSFPSQLI